MAASPHSNLIMYDHRSMASPRFGVTFFGQGLHWKIAAVSKPPPQPSYNHNDEITLMTDASMDTPQWIDCKRAYALRRSMHEWAITDTDAQSKMCVELGRELHVPNWLMVRVHARRSALVSRPRHLLL
jgi:hypothetical protein